MAEADAVVTQRLILRQWGEADAEPIAAMHRDPEVTRHLNRPVDEAVIAGFVDVMLEHWRRHGYGPWIVQLREPAESGPVVGFAGLAHVPPFLAGAGDSPELGWRLARSAWGHGYATEAARAARDDAFGRLGLPRIVSIIHPDNARSQRVATKLGLRRDRMIDNPVLGRSVYLWSLSADELLH